MGLVQCPDCHRTISDQSTACIGCGRPMTHPKPTSSERIVPDDHHAQSTNDSFESEKQESIENTDRPMRWGFAWVYIIMPLRSLFGLFAGLGMAMKNQGSTDLVWLFGGTTCVIVLAIMIGYHQRKIWAWWLNWLSVLEFIMATGIVWFPTPRLNPVGLIAGILLCGIPSTIYWRKRRDMFD